METKHQTYPLNAEYTIK